MTNNPFNEGTLWYKTFEILSDLKPHCAVCELPWSQPAKSIQVIRQHWFEFEGSKSNHLIKLYCPNCRRKTVHRRMISLERANIPILRTATLTEKLKKRIRDMYQNIDAFLWYEPSGRKVEVDHRIPQVRREENEEDYETMTDEQLKEKFMLLVREHNLLKSRNCEKCKRTWIRQPFLWINAFYEWDQNYEKPLWCKWCGWYNPEKRKEYINKKLGWSNE